LRGPVEDNSSVCLDRVTELRSLGRAFATRHCWSDHSDAANMHFLIYALAGDGLTGTVTWDTTIGTTVAWY
jgi:hypothetical protein